MHFAMHICIGDTCMDMFIMDMCITDAEVEKEVVVTIAWVTRPEHP